MKHKNSFSLGFILTFIIIITNFTAFAQLNGNYTINPRQAASSNNYRNWASAVGDLLNGSRTDGGSASGPGVSGAVNITVYDSIYDNTAIEFTAISGASTTNRITFKSNGGISSKCMIRTSSSTSTTNDYVLSINGADYLTFQEIGFERSGFNTYSNVIVISNSAVGNQFIKCLMKGRKVPSNSSQGFAYGPSSIIYFTGVADSTELIDNQIMYGYNGIFGTVGGNANKIIGNRIDTSGSSGIYMTGQNSFQILNNVINMGDFGPGKGHYTSYGFRIETSPSLIAAGNKVFMSASNGQVVRAIILASITSTSTAPAMIYNNWVVNSGGTTECTGLAVYGSSYLNFYNNNILINNSLTNASAYYHYPNFTNTSIRLQNNNLINKGGGYAINVPGTNTADIDSLDYNNYHTNGNYIGNWNATNYSTFSAWQAGSGKDAHSLNYDPGYSSTVDLHTSNIGLNGKALYDGRIRVDIDGEGRDNSTPDIGADEFFPVNLDAGVTNLDSPLLFSPGKQAVKVSFQNYGFDTIKNLEIHWQINGSTQTPFSWSGKLDPGASSSSINIGTYSFASNTKYAFKIWSKNPNGKTDEKSSNDTLRVSRIPAMAGSYRIGDTSAADFKSFNQAITALTSRGIAGAITFGVFDGTYNEQITLVNLTGMGSSNPIEFKSLKGDSSKVIVTLPATAATGSNNAAIQLRGANYVTFRGITFERTGVVTNIGQVVHILNGAHHNTFSNCQMLGLFVTNANTQAINIWSDQGIDSFNTFKKCFVQGGYLNLSFVGTSAAHEKGNVFDGNIFTGAFNNSVQIAYNDDLTLRANHFKNVASHIVGNFNAQLNDCDLALNIDGNHFYATNLDTSLHLIACNSSSSTYGIIANNFVIRNYGKAFLLDGVDYFNVAFNTMYFNSNISSNQAITTTAATSSNISIKNNNIVMDGGFAFFIPTATVISSSDNNNLWVKGGNLANWGGTNLNTLSILSSTTGMDKKSLSINPLFLSTTNLHIKNYQLKQKGTPVSGITTDIDGETRNTSTPDIGGDEFILTPNDVGMIRVSKPVAGTCAGELDVEVVIKNFGSDVLKSAVINWIINGDIQTPYNWSGSLNSLDSVKVVIGTYNFSSAFNPKFTVKAVLPNAKPDEINFNDSIIVTRALRALPNVNLGPDLTICSGDSVKIGVGTVANHTYKWTDLNGTTLSTNSELTVKPVAKTKYFLESVNTSFSCSNRDTLEISINTKPTANAGKDIAICPGTSTQIGESPQTGFTYTWTSLPKGFTSSISNPSVTPGQTTTYYVEKSITGASCSDFDTVVVTVSPIPNPKINGKDVVCNKEVLNYFTTNVVGNNFTWSIKGGKIISGQGSNSITVEWDSSGVGLLQVIEINPTKCNDINQYFVSISPNPDAQYTFKGTCLSTLTEFVNNSKDAQNYLWTFGDGFNSSAKDPSHTFGQAISYNVTLIAKNTFGCNDTLTQLVSIEPLPSSDFTFTQKPSQTIDFKSTASISSGSISSWLWRFGDGDTSVLENPSHKFASSANTNVTLCVKSVAGCEKCTTKVVGFIGIHSINQALVSLYPNPSRDKFNLSANLKMESITIMNVNGQIIESFYPNSTSFEFDLKSHSAGIYLVKISTQSGSKTLKLLKEE